MTEITVTLKINNDLLGKCQNPIWYPYIPYTPWYTWTSSDSSISLTAKAG